MTNIPFSLCYEYENLCRRDEQNAVYFQSYQSECDQSGKKPGLTPVREKEAADGSFKLVFLSDGVTDYKLELTWLRDHEGAYELGENETHICFHVEDYDAAHEKHQQMGCICYENTKMGLYFIEDPDGYWFEIVPASR